MISRKIVIGMILSMISLQQVFANNFYLGAGAGVSNSNDQQEINSSVGAPVTHDYGNLCFIGSAFGGYNFSFNNRFNLGVEAFFSLAPKEFGGYNPGGKSTLMSSRYMYGIRVLPGYEEILPNILGYAILGITRGSFSLNDTNNSITSTKFGVYGYQLGFGASTTLWKNLGTRLDLIYTRYATNTTNATSSYNNQGTIVTFPIEYLDRNTSLSGIFSLTYKFNY